MVEKEKKVEQLLKQVYPEKYIKDIDIFNLKIDIIPSGFPSLDKIKFLKQGRSELIVVGGRPGIGKSAFLFQLAYNVAEKFPVHVFSLEMDEESVVTRILATAVNKPIAAFQNGLLSKETLEAEKKKIEHLKYVIDASGSLNINELVVRIRRGQQLYGTRLVVIDYLQLIHTEKSATRDAEIGHITRELKAVAKELKIPILIGSQVNRACEIRGAGSGNYTPILADLRESGNIEQDADIVMFVNRHYKFTGERPGEADLVIAKNRNGATANIIVNFVEAQTKFIDRNYEYDKSYV